MSGTVRAGLVFGLAAVFAFVGGFILPIPCVNVIIAFVSVIALGWGAGHTAAKTTGAGPGQGTGRGLTAGAIAGGIALVGTVILLMLLSFVPGIRDAINQGLQQAAQQNPELGDANIDAGAVLGAGLAIVGFGCGAINFVLMLIAGAVGGMMWKGTSSQYVPAGGSYNAPSSGSYIPGQTNDPTYGGTQNTEGGARIYDPNDPNRPQ